jgi:hypothetical protein
MLKNIDLEKFIKAIDIEDEIDGTEYGHDSNCKYAKMLINLINEILEPGVLAWIEGEELPNLSYEKYSISDIMTRRGSKDHVLTYKDDKSYITIYKNREGYINAIRLLSIYMMSSELGEKLINWRIGN